MAVIFLDSTEDPRLHDFRDLADAATRKGPGGAVCSLGPTRGNRHLVVEGFWLLERVLATGLPVRAVLANAANVERIHPILPATCPLYVLPTREIRQLVGYRFHRGCLVCAQRPALADIRELVEPLEMPKTLVMCCNLLNPENIGGIVRTATALGVDGVILGPRCADPFSRRALRVSMGAALRMPIAMVADVVESLDTLKSDCQLQVLGAALQEGSLPLPQVRRPRRFVLLLGSEELGLDQQTMAQCDQLMTIPMTPGTDSLNANVAAGICLYELLHRQSGSVPS